MPSHPLLPSKRLPVLYFATAYASLISAFALIAVYPSEVTGFFYGSRMIAIVHLITLGWISASILGSLYIVGPLALRMPMPARAPDVAGWALLTIGSAGMVSHFWIGAPAGMAWAAIVTGVAFLPVAARTLPAVARARILPGVRLHLFLAFANVLVAAAIGTLIGFDKVYSFLSLRPLAAVSAHAHLAAVGWAVMMVVGVATRLLPMLLPAAMPGPRGLITGAIVLEAGILGLAVAFLAAPALLPVFAALIVVGIGIFLGRVAGMVLDRRPAPPGSRGFDVGKLQIALAFGWLAIAVVTGMVLSIAAQSEATIRLVSLYGIAGLVGFLSQIVSGVGSRLLPLFAAVHATAEAAAAVDGRKMPAPHELRDRRLEALATVAWAAGVPLLAAGAFLESERLVRAAGVTLTLAALCGGASAILVFRSARRPRR